MLLDGATVSNLEAAGMPAGVCIEEWICEHPEPLLKLQSDFISAGAQAIYAPTFSANGSHLAEFHLEDRVEEFNKRLVALSKSVAEPHGIPVGGTVCSSGKFIPPFGEANFDDLYNLYREQVRALDEAGVDFIVLESQTSLADMRAAVLAARTTNLPIFVTLTVDESGHTLTGGSLLPAVITLQAMGVEAIGLNCSFSPEEMLPFLTEVLPHASVPLIAKPNAGVTLSSGGEPISPKEFAEEMRGLLNAGIAIVGGCCGTTPAHIQALRRVLDEFEAEDAAPGYEDADCYAAAIESEPFFLGNDIMLSEPIECSSGLSDDLIDLDDEQVNAALVEINTLDDAMLLSQSASMTRLPVAVKTDSRTILDAALRYFQGRLIVDTNCEIETDLIERVSAKYGAIVY